LFTARRPYLPPRSSRTTSFARVVIPFARQSARRRSLPSRAVWRQLADVARQPFGQLMTPETFDAVRHDWALPPARAGGGCRMIGIEYGLMGADAEGLNVPTRANIGTAPAATVDDETTPPHDPAAYRYDVDLADVAVARLLGRAIASWLLDLTTSALSGALFARFAPRGQADIQNRLLSAMHSLCEVRAERWKQT
jgi:hypothetical protein